MMKKLITSALVAISVIAITPMAASAKWKQNSDNSWCWNENGANATGWKNINGEWYNFSKDGIMQKGWIGENGTWYYCWSNGAMAHNSWLTNGGLWYYFDENGKMVVDNKTINSVKYKFDLPAMIMSESSVNEMNKK